MQENRKWRLEAERSGFKSDYAKGRVNDWIAGSLGEIRPLEIGCASVRALDGFLEGLKKRVHSYELKPEYPVYHDLLLYTSGHVFGCTRSWRTGTTIGPMRAGAMRYSIEPNELIERQADGRTMCYRLDEPGFAEGWKLKSLLGALPADKVHLEYINSPKVWKRGAWKLDHMSDADVADTYREIDAVMLSMLSGEDLKDRSLLDVGCNRGRLLFQIARSHPQARLFGVEYNGQAIKEAYERMDGTGLKIDLREGDAARLDDVFPRRLMFDFIVCEGMMTQEVVQRRVARDIARGCHDHLKPGGKLLASGKGNMLVTPEELKSMGYAVLQTCIVENLFTDRFPKELYILGKSK
jgi:2-polyprenyl-3-methyl-5-hydroxy-6-metoxy-1,4-benzoquinol methylase